MYKQQPVHDKKQIEMYRTSEKREQRKKKMLAVKIYRNQHPHIDTKTKQKNTTGR